MTALTVPARPGEDASPRPVPWRRMAWVTWRQHRAALAGVAALLGGWAVYLWLAGSSAYHAYAAATACHPASSITCGEILSQFDYTYGDPALHAAVLLQVVPALIGAFTGAPVLARELESGTFRYTWTLAFGRWRWALAKLVLLAIAVAGAAGAFGLLFSWFFRPFFADGHDTPFAPELFDLRAVALAAWTLAAFAIGALAGLLIRRVVPAIAAALAGYAALAFAAGLYLRQHYAAPLLTTAPDVPGSAWVMSQWWTKGGRFAFGHPSNDLLMRLCPSPGPYKQSQVSVNQCLAQHGYTQWTSYQPVSRFWSFQWIEGGWLLALSALLIATTIWLVRRRAV
ncbi:MAG TPA: ABC transporter permease subunit [Streptosporangiaceae bacterium]|nr:ABC transporter permease subunit [Streptosporangiaceae bacterium]